MKKTVLREAKKLGKSMNPIMKLVVESKKYDSPRRVKKEAE